MQFSKPASFLRRGFTLIELLIVIGILGILVVAVLLTLNPAEAQKKARDTKRMRDLSTLQSIMDQYVNSGVTLAASSPNSTSGAQNCTVAGWLGIDVCSFASSVPIDPVNSTTARDVSAACGAAAPGSQAPLYRASWDASGNYEVNVVQESTSNCKNTDNANDAGNNDSRAEAGTDTTLLAN